VVWLHSATRAHKGRNEVSGSRRSVSVSVSVSVRKSEGVAE
jgi:hypothetical protein